MAATSSDEVLSVGCCDCWQDTAQQDYSVNWFIYGSRNFQLHEIQDVCKQLNLRTS